MTIRVLYTDVDGTLVGPLGNLRGAQDKRRHPNHRDQGGRGGQRTQSTQR